MTKKRATRKRTKKRAAETYHRGEELCASFDPSVNSLAVTIFENGLVYRAGLVKLSKDPWVPYREYHPRNRIVAAIDDFQFENHEELSSLLGICRRVAIEEPRVYPDQRSWKGDPDDIIQLALTIGCLINDCERRGAKVKTWKPADWKGQISKEITEQRVIKKLTEEEADRVELPTARKEQFDVIDSVGIGLWAFTNRWKGTTVATW